MPTIAHRVWKGNKHGEGMHIPLAGVAIGNGLTDPEVQYGEQPVRHGQRTARDDWLPPAAAVHPNRKIRITLIFTRLLSPLPLVSTPFPGHRTCAHP